MEFQYHNPQHLQQISSPGPTRGTSFWRWDQGDLSLIHASKEFFSSIGVPIQVETSQHNLYSAPMVWKFTNFFVNESEAQQLITNLALGACLSGYLQTDWYLYCNRRIKCQWLIFFTGANACSENNFDVEIHLYYPPDHHNFKTHQNVSFSSQKSPSPNVYGAKESLRISSEPQMNHFRSEFNSGFSYEHLNQSDRHQPQLNGLLPSISTLDSEIRPSLISKFDTLSLETPSLKEYGDSFVNGGGQDTILKRHVSRGPYQTPTTFSSPSILSSTPGNQHRECDQEFLKKRSVTVNQPSRHFQSNYLNDNHGHTKSGSWCSSISKENSSISKENSHKRSSISFLLN